jgi:hypothetical protein
MLAWHTGYNSKCYNSSSDMRLTNRSPPDVVCAVCCAVLTWPCRCHAVLCCVVQAYLMFGDRQYLDMFIELYAATMRHMKVGGAVLGGQYGVGRGGWVEGGGAQHSWHSSEVGNGLQGCAVTHKPLGYACWRIQP